MTRLEDLQHRLAVWQNTTFPDKTYASIAAHLKTEVDEVLTAETFGEGLVEIADCFTLLMGLASEYNFTMTQVLDAVEAKFVINKARNWGEPNDEGFVEHIK